MSNDDRHAEETESERRARHQRVRLQRLGLSCLSYALQIALAAVLSLLGAVSPQFVAGYAIAQCVIVVTFYVAFRTGLNLRSREPNLTLPQVLIPALPGLVLLYQLNSAEAQAALVLTTVVPLLYGTLDLSMGRFIVAAVVYSTGYLVVLFCHGLLHTEDGLFFHNWMLLASLVIVMPQIVLLSALINRMRRTLRERNHEIREAMARISVMAVRDHLTGLYNRRWLMEVLERERVRCQRAPYVFCVGVIDIDHFKRINDTHGHAVGDEVLKRLGRNMVEEVREIDSFGRFGGEEFLWIVPGTDLECALKAAERLRRRAAELVFTGEGGTQFSVTLSIGLAQNDSERRLPNDTLLRSADEALYDAKEGGRNRIVAAPRDAPVHPVTRPRIRERRGEGQN
ncbi:GGDEF domain-containing protein [Salinisphaera sp. LB1]|uniref:GGDEF domain-containing protein n=1 Tax=Salinisphaera sp. LB1 TaxID=2183911 RepID=UPI000D7D6470|nr:GGDEF domain-containing protein [Salinisphaera sp. LB1]AWN16700.1 diguanylate cyclase/phosphodiesterase (GGDEF & EAL domains) with PAS/PAC sensor(s) [Salinisphaera sp. LB1]